MRKILKILVVVVGLVTIGYFAFKDRTNQNVLPIRQIQGDTIQSSLRIGDLVYKISLPSGSSVYDLMNLALKSTQFRFEGKKFPGMGFFVDEINGIKQDARRGKYWIYYINDKEAQVGVSTYIIKPNDVISWKYEASND